MDTKKLKLYRVSKDGLHHRNILADGKQSAKEQFADYYKLKSTFGILAELIK
jgi:hypothetical protein